MALSKRMSVRRSRAMPGATTEPLLEQDERKFAAEFALTSGIPIDETIYRPLASRSIRLFRLCPTDEICNWKNILTGSWLRRSARIEMANFPLDDAPPFHAVSATLAISEHTVPIRLNGRRVHVPAALDELLEALENTIRESSAPRGGFLGHWLWLDYLCVNPACAHEAASQATLLPDLLARSEGTVVWLSPGPNPSPYHFALDAKERSRKLGTEDENFWRPGGETPQPALGNFCVEDDLLEGLNELLGQAWFTDRRGARAAQLSRAQPRVLYGSVLLSWARIMTVVEVVQRCYVPPPPERAGVGRSKSPTSPLAPAWPNTLQSMQLWIARIHELHPDAMACVKDIARGPKIVAREL